MKFILSFIIGVFLFNSVSLKAQFRDLEWGATESQIIESEGEPDMREGNMLYYQGDIADFDAYIVFELIDGELQLGFYSIRETHSNARLYINDFEKINSLIIKRYGMPKEADSRVIIDPSTADNEYIDEGLKVSTGAVAYQSIWNIDNTIILHKLTGDNYELNHGIVYKSIEYDKIKEEENVSDFD